MGPRAAWLTTSTMTSGAMPALTPTAQHSAITRSSVKLAQLCMSFAIDPEPMPPRVEHAPGDGVEHGPGALEDGALTADHHEQVARSGALHAAAYRRIQHLDALRRERGLHAPDEQRRIGGVVDVQRAGLDPLEDAAGPEADRLHLRGAGQARRDDLGPDREIGRS